MEKKKILLVGESWVTSANHTKGWDTFSSVTFHLGAEPLVDALKESPFELTYMKAHEAALDFPLSLEGLTRYDAILLSDIGSNTLLLHPDVWLQGKTVPNRLKLLKEYSARGGGLMMIGGYFSFQGIDGRARWHKTAVEEVLPVTCISYDDRFEAPEGIVAEITMPSHPIISGLDTPWPALLGVNEVKVKERQDVQVIARLPADQGGHPLLVAGSHGNGRTWHGRRISGHIGCQTPSSDGLATSGSGFRHWGGSPERCRFSLHPFSSPPRRNTLLHCSSSQHRSVRAWVAILKADVQPRRAQRTLRSAMTFPYPLCSRCPPWLEC